MIEMGIGRGKGRGETKYCVRILCWYNGSTIAKEALSLVLRELECVLPEAQVIE